MTATPGAGAFHLDDLRYDPGAVEAFDVQDLARTLDIDPSRFVPPVVSPTGEVLEGAAYLRALQLCRRPIVWVTVSPPPRPSERILDHMIFFDDLHWNTPELTTVFDRFEVSLRDALAHPNGPRGEIWRIDYSRIERDLVRITVRGKLQSENDLIRLTPPLHDLLGDLRKHVGPIRSLNGWKGVLLRPPPGPLDG